MKVVILAGGLGTRISEETEIKPKPMVEVGGKPILWHILKIYGAFGFNDFIICLGYKGYLIKEYFANYFLHNADVTIDVSQNTVQVHQSHAEQWKITLVDTGVDTQTGGRIKRIAGYLCNESFMLTYGDGVSDVDIPRLIQFHTEQGRLATITGVHPPGRFGAIVAEGNLVRAFQEKPKGDGGLINGGFFVLEPGILKYIDDDQTLWERVPLENLARDGQLAVYQHDGFWQPMDTLRDRRTLEELWASGNCPWKVWGD